MQLVNDYLTDLLRLLTDFFGNFLQLFLRIFCELLTANFYDFFATLLRHLTHLLRLFNDYFTSFLQLFTNFLPIC